MSTRINIGCCAYHKLTILIGGFEIERNDVINDIITRGEVSGRERMKKETM